MNKDNIEDKYQVLMQGYVEDEVINKNWPMKDGMYQQYSNWNEDVACESGTSCSLSPYNR